jgi:hypothetical protein
VYSGFDQSDQISRSLFLSSINLVRSTNNGVCVSNEAVWTGVSVTGALVGVAVDVVLAYAVPANMSPLGPDNRSDRCTAGPSFDAV